MRTVTIAEQEIYPAGVKIPVGYTVVAFRIPREDESFVAAPDGDRIIQCTDPSYLFAPRLIVTKDPTEAEIYVGKPVPDGWEVIDFRKPVVGEMYHDVVLNRALPWNDLNSLPQRILRKKTRKVITYRQLEDKPRRVKSGEWYAFEPILCWPFHYDSDRDYWIFSRTETEE